MKIGKERAVEIINQIGEKKIIVIGDVMLDRYFWGGVSRISPEAPVPVIDVVDETFHLGGAANVANNLKTLGVQPILCGLVGDDNSGRIFRDIATENGIDIDGLFIDVERPTTVKTRIIGNNQQIARLDRESRELISNRGERYIIEFVKSIENLGGIILEDYNKGVLSQILIREIISYSKKNNIQVFVDPKFDNFFSFNEVTVFKPNRKEASKALNMPFKNHDDIIEAGKKLLNAIKCQYVMLTLGADGMMLFDNKGNIEQIPTKARHVADVSGAGDTTVATLAACMSTGADFIESSMIANIAAGHVVEQPGIVSIKREELKALLG
jgi:D-beta-D-heptose 7-phosphate kinase/D-beta-D-heptose 1-phosphate adenosyltransferase